MFEKDEMWTMRDGTQIAVSDMEESHVRNALRMVIRHDRRRKERRAERARLEISMVDCDGAMAMTVGEMQDQLDAEARDHRGMTFNARDGYWTNLRKST
jgi:hypothetical protein